MAKKHEIIIRDLTNRWKLKLTKLLNREYLSDINVRVMLTITGIIVLVVWLVAIFRFQPSDFMVPTRYNSFLGVTGIGSWYDLYYVPGVMSLCSLINFFLGSVLYSKDKMVSYIFVGANIFLSIIALIVIINFSILVNA